MTPTDEPIPLAAGAVRSLKRRAHPVRRNAVNRLRHGRQAPRFAERLWVDPRRVKHVIGGPAGSHSGRVVSGNWDTAAAPIWSMPKYAACVEHWTRGVPWERTGIYDLMLRLINEKGQVDGCRTLADVIARYERLDGIFDQVQADGRMRTFEEITGRRRGRYGREDHGILIHVDRSGSPVHGRGGTHRLAIATVLGLPTVPARVGLIHPSALDVWRDRYSGGSWQPPAPDRTP